MLTAEFCYGSLVAILLQITPFFSSSLVRLCAFIVEKFLTKVWHGKISTGLNFLSEFAAKDIAGHFDNFINRKLNPTTFSQTNEPKYIILDHGWGTSYQTLCIQLLEKIPWGNGKDQSSDKFNIQYTSYLSSLISLKRCLWLGGNMI